MTAAVKNILFWVLMVALTLIVWGIVRSNVPGQARDLTFGEFMNEVNRDNVGGITVAGNEATGWLRKDAERFTVTLPTNYPDLYKTLLDKNINLDFKDKSDGGWIAWAAYLLPTILMVGLWIFFVAQYRKGRPSVELQAKHLEVLEREIAALRETDELLKKLIQTSK